MKHSHLQLASTVGRHCSSSVVLITLPTISIGIAGKNSDYRHCFTPWMLKFSLKNLQEKLLLSIILYALNVRAAD
jgi:hypothetical protein